MTASTYLDRHGRRQGAAPRIQPQQPLAAAGAGTPRAPSVRTSPEGVRNLALVGQMAARVRKISTRCFGKIVQARSVALIVGATTR